MCTYILNEKLPWLGIPSPKTNFEIAKTYNLKLIDFIFNWGRLSTTHYPRFSRRSSYGTLTSGVTNIVVVTMPVSVVCSQSRLYCMRRRDYRHLVRYVS